MTIANSVFKNNYARQNGGAIYSSGYESVHIVNSTFVNNYAQMKGSEYYSLFSEYYTVFENVNISNSAPVSSLYCDSVSIKVSRVRIVNNTGQALTGGAITCVNCYNINIQDSIFYNLSA